MQNHQQVVCERVVLAYNIRLLQQLCRHNLLEGKGGDVGVVPALQRVVVVASRVLLQTPSEVVPVGRAVQ